MKLPRAILIASAGVLLGTLAVGAFFGWRGHVRTRQRETQLAAVENFLATGKPREAQALLQAVRRLASNEGAGASLSERLSRLEFRAWSALKDVTHLVSAFDHNPDFLKDDEEAALLVARALATTDRAEDAGRVRAMWAGREKHPAAWLCLEADNLIAAGRRDDALALLQSRSIEGPDDCDRLLRLALLSIGNPEEASKWFDLAYKANPRNPDLRSFRAQILEGTGQANRARVEYVAALLAQPANPLLRDQLAEFYLRQRNYTMAADTFGDALRSSPLDFMRVKAVFWSRVACAPSNKAEPKDPAPGGLVPLADFIEGLPVGRFWDEESFSALKGAKAYAATRPEVVWLRLLEALRNGQEEAATDVVVTDPFRARSAHVELENSLHAMLRFRATGAKPGPDVIPPAGDSSRHQFFEDMRVWGATGQAPAGLEDFVRGPYAWSGACLAAGWLEAALLLVPTDKALPDAPDWFVFGIAQALRSQRGLGEALAFLDKQTGKSSLLALAKGELLLANGRRDEALALLAPVAKEASEPGYRAAWLLASDALDHRQPAAARAFVLAQPLLKERTLGHELLARTALVEGHENDAAILYKDLEKDSMEARALLARRAFDAKDWPEARRLTQAMADLAPDNLILQQNLRRIEEAASKP